MIGYDSRFIMQTIGDITNKHTNEKGEEKQMDIVVVRNNMEKYMAFMLGKHLVFIDSFQFMRSSLDKLVSDLTNDAFKYISEEIKNAKKLKLMKQKGVSLLYIYHFSAVIDFSSKKYSGSTGHRNSSYLRRNLQ